MKKYKNQLQSTEIGSLRREGEKVKMKLYIACNEGCEVRQNSVIDGHY